MAYLELNGITKNFPGQVAVDDLDLEVNQGDFLVLLGPSGCGKTTTLRMIAGLEVQTEGNIILEGVDISDRPPERRDMAMVFQNLALYPHMTVFDNIAFYLKNIKTPKNEITRLVKEAARTVQIEDYVNRYPDQLSGGQKQRVALARAIVRSPKIFLMDEPLASLDAKLRSSMRSEFKLLHRTLLENSGQTSGTFIYVTHDQVEALTLGTRVAVLNKGKIVQIDTPDELYRNPNSIFTATFVGTPEMNIIKGDLVKKDGKISFNINGDSIPLSGSKRMQALNKMKDNVLPAVLGIRPAALMITNPEDPGSVKMEVLTVELLGQNLMVTLRKGDLQINGLVNTEASLKFGDIVGVNFPEVSIHLFDIKSERNLLLEV